MDINLLHVWDNADGPGQCARGKDFCLSSFPVSFPLLNTVIPKLSEWMLKSSGISACRKTNPTDDVAARVLPVLGLERGRDPSAVQPSCVPPVPLWGVPRCHPLPREHLQQELCWWRGLRASCSSRAWVSDAGDGLGDCCWAMPAGAPQALPQPGTAPQGWQQCSGNSGYPQSSALQGWEKQEGRLESLGCDRIMTLYTN